jgi:acetylornithine deacetylase
MSQTKFPPAIGTILSTVDARKEEIVAFTRDLLRIPTVNSPPQGDERAGQEFLARTLRDMGLEPDLFCLDQLKGLELHPAYRVGGSVEIPRDYRDRPNLVSVWKGQGGGRSLIVTAHIDVVPPGNLALWQHDPWGAALEQGKIYARGAIDDKGPLAATVMAVACLREAGIALQGDLILQSFVDEEYGGGNGALATLVRGYRADAALMLEPTDLAVCPATYGCQSLRVSVHGQAAHPIERWKGVDAIGLACQVYRAFLDLEALRGSRARALPLFKDLEVPIPLIVRRFEALTPGGGAMPDLCEMQIWTTTLPGETQDSLLSEVRVHLAEALRDSPWLRSHPPTVEPMGRFIEPTSLPADHEFVRTLRVAHRAALGEEPTVAVGTSGDGYVYANYGAMPTVEMGPGPVHRAHAPDEYITVRELIAATKVIALTIAQWCGVA